MPQFDIRYKSNSYFSEVLQSQKYFHASSELDSDLKFLHYELEFVSTKDSIRQIIYTKNFWSFQKGGLCGFVKALKIQYQEIFVKIFLKICEIGVQHLHQHIYYLDIQHLVPIVTFGYLVLLILLPNLDCE